jgi:hypothetical protein
MRTLTSRCGRGLTLLRSAHPHQPRVWDDLDIKVCRCPRCREEIPSDDVNDDCSDNESDDDDYDPSPDAGNKRKRAESDVAYVLDLPAEYALFHPDDRVYPSSHSWRTCAQTIRRHAFCFENAEHIVSSSTLYYTLFHTNFCSLEFVS